MRTAGFTRDREGGDDTALQDDHLLANGLVEMCGCDPFGGPMSEMLPMAIAMAEGHSEDSAVARATARLSGVLRASSDAAADPSRAPLTAPDRSSAASRA